MNELLGIAREAVNTFENNLVFTDLLIELLVLSYDTIAIVPFRYFGLMTGIDVYDLGALHVREIFALSEHVP